MEFALCSIAFLLIVFGTIDFGRAIYISSDLRNAVREGVRYGSIKPTDTTGIKTKVVDRAQGIGLTSAGVSTSCNPSCTSGNNVTVSAQIQFTAVTQNLLGIPALTLKATSTAEIE